MKKTKILGYNEETPIIECVSRTDCEGLKFYCDFCKREHFHGNADGHRIAHCHKNSPFDKTGYILKLEEEK